MIPVYQTKFGAEGNCLQACIASLLEVDISEVPEFPHRGQFLHLERFMRERGLQPSGDSLGIIEGRREIVFPNESYYLLWGISPRQIRHSVVALNGQIVHDPHPEGGGLERLDMRIVFIATFERVKP